MVNDIESDEPPFVKKDAMVGVKCSPAEKKRWRRIFGRGEIGRVARRLLNLEADKVSLIKQ